uniref:Nucleolar GTP-binding protein 1 n=1 Tax=Rhizophora mucronata TaxID=61149 RepID=A0A2P2KH56_RHIMU
MPEPCDLKRKAALYASGSSGN